MTATYQGKIFALRGKMNHAGFRDFAAGEVRFLGARGQWRDDEELAEITFEFAALPNRKEIKIPDIENVAPRIRIGNGSAVVKRGWDYLWVHYRPVLDDTLKMIIQLPYAAYVEEVYETGDFGTLEI